MAETIMSERAFACNHPIQTLAERYAANDAAWSALDGDDNPMLFTPTGKQLMHTCLETRDQIAIDLEHAPLNSLADVTAALALIVELLDPHRVHSDGYIDDAETPYEGRTLRVLRRAQQTLAKIA